MYAALHYTSFLKRKKNPQVIPFFTSMLTYHFVSIFNRAALVLICMFVSGRNYVCAEDTPLICRHTSMPMPLPRATP